MINQKRFEVALSTFHTDTDGRMYSAGRFERLSVQMHLQSFWIDTDALTDTDAEQLEIAKQLQTISSDRWYLGTILARLNWQKNLIATKDLDEITGSSFMQCDIDSFLVKYRSIFDHIAKILRLIAENPGQLPDSFEKLRNWVDKNPERIDVKLKDFVLGCDWFGEMRSVRDSFIHLDGKTTVFPQEGKILFQVHKNGFRTSMINSPEIMFNENIVDFEVYAGILMANLIDCLEELAPIVDKLLEIDYLEANGRNYHLGLDITKDWIERALASTVS